jgi:hypothetical protein
MLAKDLARHDLSIDAAASAFGEDCLREDGTVSFHAMETDYRVRVSVATLEDAEALGEWIGNVMEVVASFSVSETPGPQPGRVEFEFQSEGDESLRLTVRIAEYLSDGAQLHGADLFRRFHSSN